MIGHIMTNIVSINGWQLSASILQKNARAWLAADI
jgi:hypothetical protein